MNNIKIPVNIFRNRDLAVLESLVKYMKEELKMSYAEIASELNRNDRTIWTVYSRARKKIKALEEEENYTYNVSKKEMKNTYNVSKKTK